MACIDVFFIGVPCAEDWILLGLSWRGKGFLTLHIDTADAVVWIIGSDIVGTRSSADIILLGRISCIPRVCQPDLVILTGGAYMELQ
jgi:hypothetical protein